MNAISVYLSSLSNIILKPESRLFWLSLLGALVVLLLFSGSNRRSNLASLFNLRIWLHPSSLLDMRVIAANTALKLLLITPISAVLIAGWAAIVATFTKYALFFMGQTQDLAIAALIPKWLTMIIYSLSIFLVHDFARFYLHRLQHKIPWLWCFHKVHHSAKVLTPLTLMRTHPVDILLARLRDMFALGSVNGMAFALFGSHLSAIEILGVNAFGLAFNALGANLRHSHVFLSFGRLETLFISPGAHQIHHSSNPEHFDKNFGVCLSFWDRLYGSHMDARSVSSKLHYGIEDSQLSDSSHQTLQGMFIIPIKEFFYLILARKRLD